MTTSAPAANHLLIRSLTYTMFMMFAMTTDSVGVIIPEVIRAFHLSMTAGGAVHYASMSAIALAAISLGFLADKLGRKKTIILGLILFASSEMPTFQGPSTMSVHAMVAPATLNTAKTF